MKKNNNNNTQTNIQRGMPDLGVSFIDNMNYP